MRTHFQRKKPCAAKTDIVLTDDIKQCILENRIYHIPKQQPITHNINYYNTMNNYIAGMDTLDKLNKYWVNKNIDVIPFESQIEQQYKRKNRNMRLLTGEFEINKDDIFEAIDTVTRCNNDNFSDYNVVYDSKIGKIAVRDCDSWKDMSIKKGVAFVVDKLKEFHLDNYEVYLIRKYESDNNTDTRQKQRYLELLKEYYMFLACFDIKPYVSSTLSTVVDGKDEIDIQEKYTKIYNDVEDTVSISKQKKMHNDVLDMIKSNGKQNIKDLNKYLSSVIEIDKDFRQYLISI